jgi:tRNA pseudouridine13 synthase
MHTGNRFCIELRDFSVSDDQLSERINVICGKGVPNYFGEQRFGIDGGNIEKAIALFSGHKVKDKKKTWYLPFCSSFKYF